MINIISFTIFSIFLSLIQNSFFSIFNLPINLVLGYLLVLFFFKKENLFFHFLIAGLIIDINSTYNIFGITLLLILFFYILDSIYKTIDKNILSFTITSFILLIIYFSYHQLLSIINTNIHFDIILSISQAGFNLIYCLILYAIFKKIQNKKRY